MTKEQLGLLIESYTTGKCTEKEWRFLEDWFAQWDNGMPLDLTDDEIERELEMLTAKLFPKPRKTVWLWPYFAAASVLLILLGVVIFKNKTKKQNALSPALSFAPVPNQAYLTMDNGKRILLTMPQKGTIVTQGGVDVKKGAGNLITYKVPEKMSSSAVDVYNTISTPAGSQFQVILSDGTSIWLNAMSSIKFPVSFTRSERRVEITGEAYFEVKHRAFQPFVVVADKTIIEDIGTKFNVNTYVDEKKSKTTLVEGSVRVKAENQSVLLKPGQQAQTSVFVSAPISVEAVDTEEVIAWKNGLFKFQNTPISEVMKQISRWYGVSVIYKGRVPDKTLSGEMSRDVGLSSVLDILHFFKVQFTTRIDGNKIGIVINP